MKAFFWNTTAMLLLLSKVIPTAWALFSLTGRGGGNVVRPRAATESETSSLLSQEQVDAFQTDGFIILRGLFDENEIQAMTDAGNQLVSRSKQGQFDTFSVVEKNLIYGLLESQKPNEGSIDDSETKDDESNDSEEQCDTEQAKSIVQTFRNVALRSKLAHVCAQLMALDSSSSSQCLRVIRDVYLAKYVSTGKTCDWHVDDQGFWPESFLTGAQENGSNDQPEGINVWIALDEYEPEYGGAMIVSRGSHKAPWRHEAHLAIGQNRRTDGGRTQQELLDTMTDPAFNGTCALDLSNPELRAKAEAGKVEIPLRKGDCILATRSLFHRTARVTEKGAAHFHETGQQLLHRYSIRYVVGTARLPQGEVADASAKYDPSHAGKTLNEISTPDSQPAWYPKVWPQVDPNIDERLDRLAQNELPVALRNTAEYRTEFLKLLEEERKKKGQEGRRFKT